MGAAGRRDLRIDLARGVALLIVFSDHVPGNLFRHATPGAFGLSDMAEVFVFLSGYVCGDVYGRCLLRDGFWACQIKACFRSGQIYLADIAMVAVALLWLNWWSGQARPTGIDAWLAVLGTRSDSLSVVPSILTLRVQPMQFAVLPLYLVLLLALPMMLLIFRQRLSLMVGISLALYLAVQIWPETFCLPSPWRSAWYFNPLAWQVVFFVGAAFGAGGPTFRRLLPRGAVVTVIAALGLECAFFASAFEMLDLDRWTAKADLEPLRLVHFACLLIVGRALLPESSSFGASQLAQPLIMCGQTSLPVYCASGLLAIGSGQVLLMTSGNFIWQGLVNIIGWSACIAVAVIWQHLIRRRCFHRTGRPKLLCVNGSAVATKLSSEKS